MWGTIGLQVATYATHSILLCAKTPFHIPAMATNETWLCVRRRMRFRVLFGAIGTKMGRTFCPLEVVGAIVSRLAT